MSVYYKVLTKDLQSCHGGDYQWTTGKWAPPVEINPCYTGYHLCADAAQVLIWLGESIWTAEASGQVVEAGGQVVVESARIVRQLPWDDRTARLYAADCAERVLPLFEQHSDNHAPRRTIEVARAYANGNATVEDLAAAWDAAWAASLATSWAASLATSWGTQAAARAAAWSASDAARAARAASDAAGAAAGAAAGDAARKAERKWQADRLAQYLGIKDMS